MLTDELLDLGGVGETAIQRQLRDRGAHRAEVASPEQEPVQNIFDWPWAEGHLGRGLMLSLFLGQVS
jgi:hypothetical protein